VSDRPIMCRGVDVLAAGITQENPGGSRGHGRRSKAPVVARGNDVVLGKLKPLALHPGPCHCTGTQNGRVTAARPVPGSRTNPMSKLSVSMQDLFDTKRGRIFTLKTPNGECPNSLRAGSLSPDQSASAGLWRPPALMQLSGNMAVIRRERWNIMLHPRSLIPLPGGTP
jgi:hypothetical protein